jgi:enoyl-CoA hydratase/carnithine racemase
MSEPLVVSSTLNGVCTLRMNDPRRLNGWTEELHAELRSAMGSAASDAGVGVVVLTGADPYYSAGVNLSAAVKPQHPKKIREEIRRRNQALFDEFIDFPKPLLVAVNGPAIGATVTTATLCDGVIASEKATFSTPFARLGVTPEGCSSEYWPRLIGESAARRMLGEEGWKPTAAEAMRVGLVTEVVPHGELMARAQALAESWVAAGRTRTFRAGATAAELKAINARESVVLAQAFLASPFLMGQYRFLRSRGKYGPALTFLGLRVTRPIWSLLL